MPRAATLVLICLCSTLFAAEPPAPPESSPQAPLAGPPVTEHAAAASRALDRIIARLDNDAARPEESALDELGLSIADLAPARAVIDARAAAMDRVLRDNTDTVVQIEPAMQAGEKLKGATLVLKLVSRFRETDGTQPLHSRVEEALPLAAREPYRRLVEQSYDRLIRRAIEREGDKIETGVLGSVQRGVVAAAVRAELLFKEAERSGQRVFDESAALERHAEAFLAKLSLPAEQEDKVRAIFNDWAATLAGEPTKRQLADLMLSIYDTLDEPYRRSFFEAVLLMND